MGRYVCGPSPMRLPGRETAVEPGETFDHVFGSRGEEQMALDSGAVQRAPHPTVAQPAGDPDPDPPAAEEI